MNMTMFCDASMCQRSGAAGWGAWAKRTDWQAGRFFGGAIDIGASKRVPFELLGLAQATRTLAFVGALHDLRSIMIQCDCMDALALIAYARTAEWRPSGNPADVQVLQVRKKAPDAATRRALSDIIEHLTGISVQLRHIKGHLPGDKRNWVNDQCDMEAKRHMNAMRRQSRATRFFEAQPC